MNGKTVISITFLVTLSCSNPGGPLQFLYSPPVVFTGYINKDYECLRGNLEWKNECRMVGDTIRMRFWSTDFSEQDHIRNGDMIRLDIYPGAGALVGNRDALFDMARYYEYSSSYDVTPADTVNTSNRIEMKIMQLDRAAGGYLEIDSITVLAKPVDKGEPLEIIQGRITGTIN